MHINSIKDNQTYRQLYKRIPSNNENEQNHATHYNVDGSHKSNIEQKMTERIRHTRALMYINLYEDRNRQK